MLGIACTPVVFRETVARLLKRLFDRWKALFTVNFTYLSRLQYNATWTRGNFGLFCHLCPKLPRIRVQFLCNANVKYLWKGLFHYLAHEERFICHKLATRPLLPGRVSFGVSTFHFSMFESCVFFSYTNLTFTKPRGHFVKICTGREGANLDMSPGQLTQGPKISIQNRSAV